jgi:TRAP-type C4-dicarboxylate transport system permease small subunit
MYKYLCNLNKKIVKVENALLIILLGAITLIMTAQVVMRFVFQSPLTWSQELTLFLLIYLCYFSADVVYYRDEHISVDYFVELMPSKLRKAVFVFVNLLMCFSLLYILPYTVKIIRSQADHVIAGVVPISKSYWVLPLAICFALMVLKCIEKVIACLKEKPVTEKAEVVKL